MIVSKVRVPLVFPQYKDPYRKGPPQVWESQDQTWTQSGRRCNNPKPEVGPQTLEPGYSPCVFSCSGCACTRLINWHLVRSEKIGFASPTRQFQPITGLTTCGAFLTCFRNTMMPSLSLPQSEAHCPGCPVFASSVPSGPRWGVCNGRGSSVWPCSIPSFDCFQSAGPHPGAVRT